MDTIASERAKPIKAGQSGDIAEFAYLLAIAKKDVINSVGCGGHSLLHMLICSPFSNWVCVKLLIKHQLFDLIDHRDCTHSTALDLAREFDKFGAIRALEEWEAERAS